ncbi:MAG: hypothetical protein HOP12_09725 [Candidatus Eisenbacteria bacterium]|uniref:Uncharacterized protein n=1 Tax=Eiseniibacteriota bacterium TaxID=2212470 RepID=A0A849SR08_UNCEI|nr:hypothetical protein [Candidatus Eisenbacteria bacterium]
MLGLLNSYLSYSVGATGTVILAYSAFGPTPPFWNELTIRDAVPLVGILIAGAVAMVGWRKTAETAMRAQERRHELDRANTKEVLRDAVWEGLGTAIVWLPQVIEAITAKRFVSRLLLGQLDEGRSSYDRNRDSMVFWENKEEKLRVQLWFREMAVWRASLDTFAPPTPGETPTPIYSEVAAQLLPLLKAALDDATGLFEELDFPRVHPGHAGYEKWAPPRRQ